MCFGCKVHDRVERMFLEHLANLLWVGNVTANETISRIVGNLVQVAEISCIGEQVEVPNFDISPLAKNVSDETRTYKTGSAGNEQLHCCLRIEAEPWMAACGISSAFASD